MTDKSKCSILMLVVSIICLMTVSSCLSSDSFSPVSSVLKNDNVTVCAFSLHTPPEVGSSGHHDAVKGKVADLDRIADVSDKGSIKDKKDCRSFSYGHFKKTATSISLHTYTSELLNSSHLVPPTIIRI